MGIGVRLGHVGQHIVFLWIGDVVLGSSIVVHLGTRKRVCQFADVYCVASCIMVCPVSSSGSFALAASLIFVIDGGLYMVDWYLAKQERKLDDISSPRKYGWLKACAALGLTGPVYQDTMEAR